MCVCVCVCVCVLVCALSPTAAEVYKPPPLYTPHRVYEIRIPMHVFFVLQVDNIVAPCCMLLQDYLNDTPMPRYMGVWVSQCEEIGCDAPPQCANLRGEIPLVKRAL